MHTYRPLLSYVGGGQASMRSAERTQRSVTPRKCTWLEDSAVVVDAPARPCGAPPDGATGRRASHRGAGRNVPRGNELLSGQSRENTACGVASVISHCSSHNG